LYEHYALAPGHQMSDISFHGASLSKSSTKDSKNEFKYMKQIDNNFQVVFNTCNINEQNVRKYETEEW